MPCTVKKTFEAARDTGNILIVQIKANQPDLLKKAEALCTAAFPVSSAETVDKKRHGRQEHRRVEIFKASGHLDQDDQDWGDLIAAVARVTRLTWHKDTKSGFWHDTHEISFYACQAILGAVEIGGAIRGHWGIENRNNHVRDVSFFEDHSRIRKSPGIFARLRSFACNILRANGAKNIGQELYENALNPLRALAYPRA